MPAKLATSGLEIPEVSWDEFQRKFVWNQGEHMTLIGPNGRGKTTVVRPLLQRVPFVVVFATKSKDTTMDGYRKDGFEIIRKWPPPPDMNRCILWPIGGPGGGKNAPKDPLEDKVVKQAVFRKALADIYRRGGWCIVLDETRYVTDSLKLGGPVQELWMQGRSMGITLVANVQRPAWVPLAAYSEMKHLFVWENPDEANQKRLGEISSIREIQQIAQTLRYHQFIYVNTRLRQRMISQVDLAA